MEGISKTYEGIEADTKAKVEGEAARRFIKETGMSFLTIEYLCNTSGLIHFRMEGDKRIKYPMFQEN